MYFVLLIFALGTVIQCENEINILPSNYILKVEHDSARVKRTALETSDEDSDEDDTTLANVYTPTTVKNLAFPSNKGFKTNGLTKQSSVKLIILNKKSGHRFGSRDENSGRFPYGSNYPYYGSNNPYFGVNPYNLTYPYGVPNYGVPNYGVYPYNITNTNPYQTYPTYPNNQYYSNYPNIYRTNTSVYPYNPFIASTQSPFFTNFNGIPIPNTNALNSLINTLFRNGDGTVPMTNTSLIPVPGQSMQFGQK